MTLRYSTDIVIFGGGIAGLWLLNRLKSNGFKAVLFEIDSLGSKQTFASQGIIHGGLKYALGGSLTGAANVIAEMPQRWRQCLAGKGDINLEGVPILSDRYYMWSDGSLTSKLKTFLGSKSLVGRVEAVPKNNYPEFFAAATVNGTLYQLPDFVIDSSRLIQKLAEPVRESLFKLNKENCEFEIDASCGARKIMLHQNKEPIEIKTSRIIFCAGEGNTELIKKAQLNSIATQTRPLHMVYLKSPNLPRLFTHCIGDDFSLTPKLTVTSHKNLEEQMVWYLGGELAEQGVDLSQTEQLESAQKLIADLFPWIDTGDAIWNSFKINRAEANIQNNYRPDDAYIAEEANVIAAWPTKLTLTPSMADKLLGELQKQSIVPIHNDDSEFELSEFLEAPQLSSAYWD